MAEDETPIAHPGKYTGPGVQQKAFAGIGFGLVFEDDRKTGYLYATTEDFAGVLDALHLYNRRDPAQPRKGETFYFVWHPALLKAGIFYHDRFQAVVDFKNRNACCRTGFPTGGAGSWGNSRHAWDEGMAIGLGP